MLEKLFFAKIEAWVVALLCFLGLITFLFFAYVVQSTARGSTQFGAVGKASLRVARAPDKAAYVLRELTGNSDKIRRPDAKYLKNLNNIGEGTGAQGYLTQFNDKAGTFDLVSLSDGSVAHSWKVEGMEPPVAVSMFDETILVGGVRGAEDSTVELAKRNKAGETLWRTEISSHHLVFVAADGYIYTSIISKHEPTQKLLGAKNYRDDGWAILSPDGKIVDQGSVTQMLIDNGLGHMIYGVGPLETDPIHMNAVRVAEIESEYWDVGDLLMSARHISMVFLYRPSTKKIIWYKSGPWLNQHDPDFISDTQISVFGNDVVSTSGDRTGERAPYLDEDRNKIYVYDFATDTVETPFQEQMRRFDLATVTGGRHTILSDGSLFSWFANTGLGALYSAQTDEVRYFGRLVDDGVVDRRSGIYAYPELIGAAQ